jgi:predicted ester cyclase
MVWKITSATVREITLVQFFFLVLMIQHAIAQTSEDKNKEAARFFIEDVLGNGKERELYKLTHTADFVGHSGEFTFSLEDDYQAALDNRKGLPDLTMRVTKQVSENDMVVVLWIAEGTNTGINTFLPTATGKKLKVEGITIFRMKDGKIAEEWGHHNLASVLIKNGLLDCR